MLTQSRRTFAALAFAGGLLATLPALAQSTLAADERDAATALRAGGLVIVVRHGATFPNQADTDPLNFDNIAAQRISTATARRWPKRSAQHFGKSAFRLARYTPASTTVHMRQRRLRASRMSRRPRISPKAGLSCRRTRTAVVPKLFAD